MAGGLQPMLCVPHTCCSCRKFVIHLFDELNQPPTDSPIWYGPNPSQTSPARRLYGDRFWTPEWTEYREYFFERTIGISFFDVSKEDLSRYSDQGCLLSRRFLQCMRDDELPQSYAIGAKMLRPYSVELCVVDLENLRWEMLLAGDDDEEPDNVYSVIVEKGSIAAQVVENQPINMRPGAVESLVDAKGWLEECMREHHTCIKPNPGFKPTRLVEIIGDHNRVRCRLVETSREENEPYAALSYCWGGDQTFKTTAKAVERYLENIDADVLPQTLQDAIFVTQNLGINYLWIDALCIIQDSAADKAVEIGRMAQVYGNATVTIAATRANAVWEGFLGDRAALGSRSPTKIFSLPCQGSGRSLGMLTLLPFTYENTDPLDTRGWTFQERVLSPRVIDFGTLRTLYTCQTTLGHIHSDGWSSLPIDRAYGSDLDSQVISDLIAGVYPAEEMLQYWLKIVQGFTSRALSFTTDRLPAIAGMAECFGSVLRDQYCAGLWRKGMPESLLWTAGTRIQHIQNDLEPRLCGDSIAAPSWSWGAVSRPVQYDPLYTQRTDDHITFLAEIRDCDLELEDDRAQYGALKKGLLTLQCWIRPANWVMKNIYGDPKILLAAEDGAEAFGLGFRGGERTGISFVPDASEPEFTDDPSRSLDVYLMLFGTVRTDEASGLYPSFFGIVARKVKGEGAIFSRVGIFQKTIDRREWDRYMEWFQHKDKREVVLV